MTPSNQRRRLAMSASGGEEPSPGRNWLDLPREITASILLKVGPKEIFETAQWVCPRWFSICKDPSMWTAIDMPLGDTRFRTAEDFQAICRLAVHRSCGGLLDIRIEHFVTDRLLRHITESCTRIKRLRLIRCHNLTSKGLIETTAKLPLLEELELTHYGVSAEAIEATGHHCPRLKSLNLRNRWLQFRHIEADDEARAVAKTMPELRLLELSGSMLSNEGLQAVLDGCPKLEFLDLRGCFKVDLSGKLGERCAEMIKDFRRP